jgi:hypothetical protein
MSRDGHRGRLGLTTAGCIASVLVLAVAVEPAVAARTDIRVRFRTANDVGTNGTRRAGYHAGEACFSGGFPKSHRGPGGGRTYDLNVGLVVTMTGIRRVDRSTGQARKLRGSQRRFAFNLENRKDYKGRPFYSVRASPDGTSPCAAVEILNSAPAGFEQEATVTGRLRIRVSADGRALGSRSWTWTIRTRGRHTVWQGTDAFAGVCVAERLPLRSWNRTRYCVQPAFASIRVRGVR